MSIPNERVPSHLPRRRPSRDVIPLHEDAGDGRKWMAGAIGLTLALAIGSGVLVYSTLRIRFQRTGLVIDVRDANFLTLCKHAARGES